jgi:hypothetical protein
MPNMELIALALGLLAILIAVIGLVRSSRSANTGLLTQQQASELFRGEHDRLRAALDEQLRGIRSEIADRIRSLQESSVLTVGELGKVLKAQGTEIGERLPATERMGTTMNLSPRSNTRWSGRSVSLGT